MLEVLRGCGGAALGSERDLTGECGCERDLTGECGLARPHWHSL